MTEARDRHGLLLFGHEIGRRRRAAGWSLRHLAEQTGLSASYLHDLEVGARNPSLSTMRALARGFRVSLADLLGNGSFTPAGTEFASMFQRACDDVQSALLRLLRCQFNPRRRGEVPW